MFEGIGGGDQGDGSDFEGRRRGEEGDRFGDEGEGGRIWTEGQIAIEGDPECRDEFIEFDCIGEYRS